MFITRWLLVPLLSMAVLGGLAASVWSGQENAETVGGALVVQGDLSVRGLVIIDGALIVSGSIRTTSGDLQIVSRGTPPESSSGKAVRVSGPREVEGPLMVHGSLTVDGDLTVDGPISVAGTIATLGQR